MARPKITYNSINLTFPDGAGAQNLNIERQDITSKSQASSGIQKFLHFYQNKFIKFTLPYYTRDFENELIQLYEYCRTGNACKLILNTDVGLYIPFEGKSASSLDGDAQTFSRATIGSYTDYSTGLIADVMSGERRLPAGKYGAGQIIENAATNLLLWNETMGDADGWAGGGTTTVTENSIIAPDGTLTASKIEFSGLSYRRYDTSTVINNDDGCVSVWLKLLSGTKAATSNFLLVVADDAGNALGSTQMDITSEWQKFYTYYDNPGAGNANNWRFQLQQISGSTTVYAWRPQLETGRRFPTTGLYTTSAAVTRNIELAYYSLSDDNLNKDGFTISAWVKPEYDYNKINTYKTYFYITKSGATDAMLSLVATTSNTLEFKVYDYEDNANEISYSSATVIARDTWVHLAVTVDPTISNGLKIYVNGVLKATDTNDAFTLNAFDRFYLGSAATTNAADAVFDDVCIHNRVLTAAELLEYVNSGEAWGYQQNIFDNVYFKNFNYVTNIVNGAKRIEGTVLEFEEKIT